MKEKNLIFFYGIRRSGNHAIINWIKDNFKRWKQMKDHEYVKMLLKDENFKKKVEKYFTQEELGFK